MKLYYKERDQISFNIPTIVLNAHAYAQMSRVHLSLNLAIQADYGLAWPEFDNFNLIKC